MSWLSCSDDNVESGSLSWYTGCPELLLPWQWCWDHEPEQGQCNMYPPTTCRTILRTDVHRGKKITTIKYGFILNHFWICKFQ